MKKIIALTLAVLMIVCCAAGCGKKNNTLTMATNAEFPPYEYYEGQTVTGIDVEIAQLIANELDMELVIVDTDFDAVIPGVQGGKYDMGMSGITITEERKEQVCFTVPYTTAVQAIIVPEGSPITCADDLFGDGNYTIGVQTGTTGDLYSTWDIEDAGLGTVSRYNKGADAVAALVSGKIDCVIIDNEPAKAFAEANPGLIVLDTAYAVEEYAICYGKNNTELGEKIDAALQKLIASGEVQAIIDKYITD